MDRARRVKHFGRAAFFLWMFTVVGSLAIAQTSSSDARIKDLEERVRLLESQYQGISSAAEADARRAIASFQQALADRDLAAIETLVAPDIVVLENGHRNDGWTDFRDNHLKPEFAETAATSSWEFIKVAATPNMAWGYTRQIIPLPSKEGQKSTALVWSIYVLERRGGQWKIVLLDWSVKVQHPSKS